MRVIIELTEDEARSTKISREATDQPSQAGSETRDIPTSDGGSPSDDLLSSLGAGGFAMSGTGRNGSGGATMNGGDVTNAGEPSGWMSIAMGDSGG